MAATCSCLQVSGAALMSKSQELGCAAWDASGSMRLASAEGGQIQVRQKASVLPPLCLQKSCSCTVLLCLLCTAGLGPAPARQAAHHP